MIKRTGKIQQYLKIPYHILNIPDIGLEEKVLLSHFYSFGPKGCWQSNKTLADLFKISTFTITRRLRELKHYIKIENPRGPRRRLWAISFYPMKSNNIDKNAQRPQQNCSGILNKTVERPQQNCPTYYNSIREITTPASFCRKTDAGASPCPRPLEGGSAATPEERQSNPIGHLTESIGKHGKWKPLSEEEFQKRREKLQKTLLGDNWKEKLDEIKSKDFPALRKKQNDKSKKMA
jgi:hypothetical protein